MARINGQNIVKYSDFSADDVVCDVVKAWAAVYSDCKIVSLSIVESNGMYAAYVVFEEMKVTDDGKSD